MKRPTMVAALAFVAGTAVAASPPTQADMEADRAAAFAQADADGDGALTLAEWKTFHTLMEEKRTERVFAAIDADGSGSVTSAELASFRPPRRGGRGSGGFGPR